MPSARQSTLSRPRASRSSLSHWMTVRSAIAAFSTGTSVRQRVLGDHEAARRAATGAAGSRAVRRSAPARAASAGLSGSKPCSRRRSSASARRCSSDPALRPSCVDLVRRQAERPRHVAHRAARRDSGSPSRPARRVRGRSARRRTGALPRAARARSRRRCPAARCAPPTGSARTAGPSRPDRRGDAEREAHRRIGRRAAALAEDVPAAREADDVVHGEEVRLVAAARAISASSFSISCALRALLAGVAFRPAPAHAVFGQLAQPAASACGRPAPVRAGYSYSQLAAGRNVQRCGDAHAFRPAAAADRSPPAPGACAGGVRRWGTGACRLAASVVRMADRGHRVLQRAPAAHVHVHVAAGDGRHAQRARRVPAVAAAARASSAPRCSSTASHRRSRETRAAASAPSQRRRRRVAAPTAPAGRRQAVVEILAQ